MKKHFYFLFTCILFAGASHAQERSSGFGDFGKTYVESMDSLLQDVDKQAVTTGILYSRVMPFAHLDKFNERNDTSDYKHFRQAWSELYRASYAPGFKDFSLLEAQLDRNLQHDVVDVGIIQARFHVLDLGPDKARASVDFENGRFKSIPTATNKSYNQWRVMSKYKVLSSLLRLVTVDNNVFKNRHWL